MFKIFKMLRRYFIITSCLGKSHVLKSDCKSVDLWSRKQCLGIGTSFLAPLLVEETLPSFL